MAPSPDEQKILELESKINDLADMANLTINAAERWIDGAVAKDGVSVRIPENERKMIMFGIGQLDYLSRTLREEFYAACK